ncbi:MAG TPA: hypothetical protein VFI52_19050 [Gemmatimonadaceae bacterium]|nr:hypothetical protein [Gemmatimonadaceae bacterium]
MKSTRSAGRRFMRWSVGSLSLAAGAMSAVSCATSGVGSTSAPGAARVASTTDPRVGLRAGMTDAAEAISNMRLVSHSAKPSLLEGEGGARGLTFANSDLAFAGNYVYQGNFSGFQIWDIANPASPVLRKAVLCATGQGDPSIYGNLLFLSSESTGNRTDCGTQGIADRVSPDRMVGVRIYDISDMANPRKVADVQTCRGSHTHTLVPDPTDKSIVYVYVAGSAGVRSADELAGCLDAPIDSANTSRFRVEVIRVPLAHPEEAKIVGYARIFNDLAAAHAHGAAPGDAGAPARAPRPAPAGAAPAVRTGPNQCHDITVYPAIGLAGGACGGYGLLLDIHDPINPKRLQAVGDTNFAFWHSATFNNDGTKLLFTDEWGGGTQPKCRSDDPIDWGGDAIFTLKDGRLTQGAYFKMPAAQSKMENCVAHNGSLVPVPGRDIMVQGWYQGGLDVIDFTDANHPYEIAYFDRGPVDATKLVTAGYWAGYWYNGHIIGSEIARGLDIFELTPSQYLSQNEIDAAKLVHFDTFNPQMQPKIVWPAAFPVVRSYLDQLVRGNGLATARTSAIAAELNAAEKLNGAERRAALNAVASQLDGDAAGAADAARVRAMAAAVRDLANAM